MAALSKIRNILYVLDSYYYSRTKKVSVVSDFRENIVPKMEDHFAGFFNEKVFAGRVPRVRAQATTTKWRQEKEVYRETQFHSAQETMCKRMYKASIVINGYHGIHLQ